MLCIGVVCINGKNIPNSVGAGAFGQPDRSGGAYGQNAYGAYGSMLQQAAYAGAPGAAASPYGANYGMFIFLWIQMSRFFCY